MIFHSYTPRPPLSDFVEMFWFYEGHDPPHAKERILPTATTELVINLRDDESRVYDLQDTDRFQSFGGAVVCGPHSQFFVIDTAQQASVMGVHFKPGGASPFLKLPACEIRNAHVSLETLWGARAVELRDRLLEAEMPETRFYVLEQALLAQVALPLVRHPAVALALKQFQSMPHTQRISDVSHWTGLSQRRFIQVFSEEVGLTPKLFCRVRRFQEIVSLIGRGQPVEWTELALECGYYDQAHFIHDFRAFSGLNPTAYLTCKGEHLNHVPLRDQ